MARCIGPVPRPRQLEGCGAAAKRSRQARWVYRRVFRDKVAMRSVASAIAIGFILGFERYGLRPGRPDNP